MNRLSIIIVLPAMALSAVAQCMPTMGWSSWNTFALDIDKMVLD